MGTILNKLFGRSGVETDDDTLGCDMVPAPTLLAASFANLDPANDDNALRPAPSAEFGPFTSSAQAPIRDS